MLSRRGYSKEWRDSRFFLLTHPARAQLLQLLVLTSSWLMYAPVFPKVWAQIEPLIEGLPLVAHNKPFDEGCLKAVFRVYRMDYPDYVFYDTLCASRRAFRYLPNHQLHTVAAECGYCLENHHHALADAEACAWIAREIL